MRRTCNAVVEARTTDSLEATRRLHRSVTEIVKRLDEQKNRALTVCDIFIPSVEVLRVKLKDYCERLILKDPVGNARKTEELLWRKAFYDVVYAAKKLRKTNQWNESEKALLSVHLAVGVGYYHHLILRLQSEYDLDLVGVIDFAFTRFESISSYARWMAKMEQPKLTHTKEVKQCVMRLIHRSLVCLGDLTRYKLELDSDWDPMIANRYYKMAIAIDPNIGMPHNQLGTIAGGKNYGLDAVYHYMRCVLCPELFEGAEGNLKRSIITNSTCTDENNLVHHCVSRLFSLLRLWDYDNPNSDKINQECQDLLTDIENCLIIEQSETNNTSSLENADNIETYLQNCKSRPALYLTDDMVFKIVTICLMSISRLKSRESSEVQGVVAITLAILSQLLQFTITKLQALVMETAVPDVEVNANSYSSKLKNALKKEAPRDEREDSVDHVPKENSVSNQDNNTSNLNKKEQSHAIEGAKSLDNGVTNNETSKKTREKSKSLLSKLRRRKRRTSSDSDASDTEQPVLVSSSDEMHSETEEDDALSEENDALSEDALSDDNTDDEELLSLRNKKQSDENATKKEINGHADVADCKTEDSVNKDDNSQLVNGEQRVADEQAEPKPISDQDSVTNSAGSAVTITTNPDSTSSAFEESSNSNSSNTVTCMAQSKKQSLKSNSVLNLLIGKEILASIKVCFDWLRSSPDIVRICAKSSRILLKRVTILLNLINVDGEAFLPKNEDSAILASAERLRECVRTLPLPEDNDLKGLTLLEEAHRSLNWCILHKHKMSKREETLLRMLKLVEFGRHLSAIEESGVQYDPVERLFVASDYSPSNAPKPVGLDEKKFNMEHPRNKLMRHMGKLWLKAEVRALESQLHFRLMSPYLVPDHEALAKYTPTLKRLVYAKIFVVVIPAAVVSALDEVKRISGQAREATRWLEIQLRRGTRFLRAQRPHERLALPLIKGPRPKDKEAWLFFQIIECCHYLTQQAKAGFTGDGEAPVVTLLTGCNPDERKALTFSPDGLAKSAGVNLEHIESFQTKWKSSSKSHG
ncbi:protein SMG5 isoform X2 [Harpegnathos saltator]|uniref:Protein SMG5 n=1 Tax=Harpegnathos saltator TaxID=610380 RepID=E2B3D6_HARSA|nr:protein SMG5 isoform X2 [Harpegnathos saltator]EFN89814.1 Protein SMG5 [Harpegnathos saltator]